MHDNLKPMEDVVSDISVKEGELEKQLEFSEDKNSKKIPSLKRDAELYYRFCRKSLLQFWQEHSKKYFTNILYVTDGTYSQEYILGLQKQYPDKNIIVLVPHFGNIKDSDKSAANLDYNIHNQHYSAKLYQYTISHNNIQVYGIYSKIFSDLEKVSDIYKIQNIIHYSICARLAAKHLKYDIIHAENIPYLLGLEFTKSKLNNLKLLQTIHHITMYTDLEPFWAAINFMSKKEISKLLSDKNIKKNLAALFGIKNVSNFSKLNSCLDYLYKNFEQYRKSYTKDENTNENILIERLNKRTVELFPSAFYQNTFNPVYFSIKNSASWAVNSPIQQNIEWLKSVQESRLIKQGKSSNSDDKIAHPFDVSNFRYYREYNKQYLVKEFSERQIKTNFTDNNLFKNNNAKIYGFLDSFYKGTLLLTLFDNLKENDIKMATSSILKCFELKKNIQVIFNIPKNFENSYVKTLIEFFESQPTLVGKWLFIEGDINLPQFMAASDMILLPCGDAIGVEEELYTALKYGCIPVANNIGICGNIITDIFDNMSLGFGFKNHKTDDSCAYADTLIKALNFYINNFTSWKILIKNAINYDSNWNFDTIEQYNKLYDKILES